jgi:glycosyltransferase involved in cell wall biosynthesis
MKRKRLAILSTHPIQYHSAWYRALASSPGIDLEVLFCHKATPREQADAGFGVEFDWDSSLLDGYPHRFLKNTAKRQSVSTFCGLDTPEVTSVLENEQFDSVIVNGWHYKSAWQAIWRCWHSETPVMVRGDSHLHTSRPFIRQTLKWPFYRWFIPKVDACLAVGLWSREYYLHYGASPERVFFVPHAVDHAVFGANLEQAAAQQAALRNEWNLNPAAVVYVFVGKFTKVKRPMDFVTSIEDAARDGAGIMGLMVGDGPMRRECENYVNRNQIPVRLTGFLNQSQIARAYLAADALVLPSDCETWGVAVNEAMACGRPCFVSDKVGSRPDMIDEDETGASFPAGDRIALKSLLSTYAANKQRLTQMGEKAKRKAREYSVGVAVEGVLRALEVVG